MTRPTKASLASMNEAILHDLSRLKQGEVNAEAMQGVETFVAIAMHVFATTNPSKIRKAAETLDMQRLWNDPSRFERKQA